jgi:hypothetical protein
VQNKVSSNDDTVSILEWVDGNLSEIESNDRDNDNYESEQKSST